ncbi:Schwann cell myelin protein-like [Mixophyes fleayi]|uniref:Schwann cell myelin protein-like n=1 Tax=Mixophyes fleayi TaxID=3061075 RepID=UPI003F4DC88A
MSVTRILFLVLFQGFQSGILSQKWEFPTEIVALIGSCVEIPCTYSPAKSSIVWYLYDSLYYYEVFNSKTSSSVRNDYIRRTSLVPGGICSLRIDPVRETDKGRYYPGKDRSQNAYDLQSRTITLHVTDTQRQPTLIGSGNMMAGKVSIIQCYADHTCATSPPSLEWNKPGQTKRLLIQLSGGNWREISQLTYIPSYADDKTPLRCTATYPNSLRSQQEAPLNINFSPKNVIVTLRGNNKLIEGSDVTLSCKSLSNPPIHTYEWYKGKNKIRLRNPWPEIIVRNLTRDIEPYSCAAVNNEGRGESALTEIPVQYAPTGVLIIESQAEDGPTVLTCYYMSSRPNVTHYSWLKDNSLLPNETRQTLMMDKSEEHYGSYTCVAHNSVGTSFSQAVNIAGQYLVIQAHTESFC